MSTELNYRLTLDHDSFVRGMGSARQEVDSLAGNLRAALPMAAGAFGVLTAAATAAATAVTAARAVLTAAGTKEATASLEEYSGAWENLSSAASEATTGLAQAIAPLASGVLSTASRLVNSIAQDLRGITSFLGLAQDDPAARFAGDNAARAAREAERAEVDRLAQDKADAANENNALALDLDEQRIARQRAIDARRAAEAAAAAQRNAAREAAAQEQVFEATLTREQNLKRRIDAIRASGPTGADAVNSLDPGSDARAAAAERTAVLVSLQKELADLKAREAAEAEKSAAAVAKAAAAESARLAAQGRRILEANRAAAGGAAAAADPAARPNILSAQQTAAARVARLREQISQREARGETIGTSMRLALDSAVRRSGGAKPPPDPQLKKLDTLSSIDARLADLGLAN